MEILELQQDIQTLKDFPTVQQKKQLSQKYGAQSLKSKEIIFKIELILLDKITDKSSEDYRMAWLRHFDFPLSVAKIRDLITAEADAVIIRNILSYYQQRYERTHDTTHRSIVRYLSSLLNSSDDTTVQDITDKLMGITTEFKEKLETSAINQAQHYYKEIRTLISYNLSSDDFKSFFGTVEPRVSCGQRLYKSPIAIIELWSRKFTAKEVNSNHRMSALAIRLTRDCCQLRGKSLQGYLATVSEDFNRWYSQQISKVALELKKKGLDNVNSLKVIAIKEDAKGFYSVITDGKVTVKTRAIPCCANSELISFHYRFISTIIR